MPRVCATLIRSGSFFSHVFADARYFKFSSSLRVLKNKGGPLVNIIKKFTRHGNALVTPFSLVESQCFGFANYKINTIFVAHHMFFRPIDVAKSLTHAPLPESTLLSPLKVVLTAFPRSDASSSSPWRLQAFPLFLLGVNIGSPAYLIQPRNGCSRDMGVSVLQVCTRLDTTKRM